MKVVLILFFFASDRFGATSTFERIEGFTTVENCQSAAKKYLSEMNSYRASHFDYNCIVVE